MKLPQAVLSKLTVKRLQRIEPKVRALRIVQGEDHSGDPALFLRIVLDDSVTDEQLLSPGSLQALRDWIFKTVWNGTEFQLYPYVTFTRSSEEKEAAMA